MRAFCFIFIFLYCRLSNAITFNIAVPMKELIAYRQSVMRVFLRLDDVNKLSY